MVVIFLGSSLLLVNISIVFALCIAFCAIDLKDTYSGCCALSFQLVDVHHGLTNLCVLLRSLFGTLYLRMPPCRKKRGEFP